MDAQRRAQVVEMLRWHFEFYPSSTLAQACRDAADELEAKEGPPHAYVEWPRQDYLPADAALPANHPCKACCKPKSAHVTPKPSESSMVQRIEALEEFARKVSMVETRPQDRESWAGRALLAIKAKAAMVLDGPPDPERDRESKSEVLKP